MKKSGFKCCIMGFICLSSISVHAECDEVHWEKYKEECGKVYERKENEVRMKIFQENCILVNNHNEKFKNGQVTYSVKITCRSSDKTQEELNGGTLRLKKEGPEIIKKDKNFKDNSKVEEPLPDSFDWRSQVDISPIVDQSYCSSAWALITSDILQDLCLIRKGTRISRPSTQELIDCCREGRIESAFEYIKANGISSEKDYNSTDEIGKCRRSNTTSTVSISGYINIPHDDVQGLKKYLIKNGPVAIEVDSNALFFCQFNQGIYQEPKCSSYDTSIFLMIVGYGKENGMDYWICKSTLGPCWGENGYIKLAANNHLCGVSTRVSSPIITMCNPH